MNNLKHFFLYVMLHGMVRVFLVVVGSYLLDLLSTFLPFPSLLPCLGNPRSRRTVSNKARQFALTRVWMEVTQGKACFQCMPLHMMQCMCLFILFPLCSYRSAHLSAYYSLTSQCPSTQLIENQFILPLYFILLCIPQTRHTVKTFLRRTCMLLPCDCCSCCTCAWTRIMMYPVKNAIAA